MSVAIEHITKSFGKQKALNDISFALKPGEIVGFLGPNGAGKSTMMKIITGFLAADEGSVKINGELIHSGKVDFKRQIGYLPEQNPLYNDLYIREYLEICAGFYQLRNRKTRIDEIIQLTGLEPEISKKISQLSKGYKQRVGLAQALLHDPAVLILDEPTTGLDPNQLDEIRQLIVTIGKNKTVLFSTHILQEVEAICTRAIIINQGKKLADGNIYDLKQKLFTGSSEIVIEFEQDVDEDLFSDLKSISGISRINSKSFSIYGSGKEDLRPLLFKLAVAKQLTIISLYQKENSLNQIFHKLTNSSIR